MTNSNRRPPRNRSTSPRARARAQGAERQGGRSPADAAASPQVSGPSLDRASSGEKPEWQPNPNPRHPDFEPGNTLSLVHGGTSPAAIAERAQLVHAALLEAAPYLNEPRFLPAAHRYLTAAAREALLHEHIVRVSADKGPGAVPARMWEQATAASRLAARLGSDLGLDPIGHARIRALSVGAEATEQSLDDLRREGAEIRRRAAAARAAEPPDVLEASDEPEEVSDGD